MMRYLWHDLKNIQTVSTYNIPIVLMDPSIPNMCPVMSDSSNSATYEEPSHKRFFGSQIISLIYLNLNAIHSKN